MGQQFFYIFETVKEHRRAFPVRASLGLSSKFQPLEPDAVGANLCQIVKGLLG